MRRTIVPMLSAVGVHAGVVEFNLRTGQWSSASRRKPVSRRVAVACAAASVAIGSLGGVALAHKLMPTPDYWGGPVQHHPKLHLVFWGPGFASRSSRQLRHYVSNFVRNLDDSSYLAGLSQYHDGQGRVTDHVRLADVVVDPKLPDVPISQAQILHEIHRLAQRHGWKPGIEEQVILIPDASAWIDRGRGDFCAYHGSSKGKKPWVYSFVPVDPRCWGDGTTPGDVTFSSWSLQRNEERGLVYATSHEIVEALTDPEPNTGYTWHSGEVADICIGNPAWWKGYPVTFYYDAAGHRCAAGREATPPSPALG